MKSHSVLLVQSLHPEILNGNVGSDYLVLNN